MKRQYCIIFLSIALFATGISAFSKDKAAKSPLRLTTASDLAMKASPSIDSHSGKEQWSSLQMISSSYIVLPHSFLTAGAPGDQHTAIYPRVKKMADGRYIMFWHGGRLGTRVWYSTSADLKNWDKPQLIFGPENVVVDGVEDTRRHVNPDAVVMPDGEILAVISYRASKHYKFGVGSGLVLIRSNDNGKSWSEPKVIYEGCNWEPYLLLLPDGRLHCYFTDAVPQSRNSGTSLIISSDKGENWSEKMRVSRQYKYKYDGPNTDFTGVNVYTDQMPCFRVLNDGKTIFGFLEARLEEPGSINGKTYMRMSAVYNDGLDWKALGENETGPQRRHTNCMTAAAGYVSVFPSGEVIASCNNERLFMMKVLDSKGECTPDSDWSSDWLRPFPAKGYWGATEVDSPRSLVAAMHCDEGMQIARFWLNHSLDAERIKIKLDGDNGEWDSTEAFFLDSKDGDESIIRAANDGRYLYLLVETASKSDKLKLKLLLNNAQKSAELPLEMEIYASEIKLNPEAKALKIKSISQKAISADSREGWISELRIPLSLLKLQANESIFLFAESCSASGSNSFSLSDKENLNSWQQIILK